MSGFESLAGLSVLLVRPGMLIIGTPFLGGVYAPAALRVGLTVLLAILLAPFVQVPASLPLTGLAVVLAREVAIGLALAFAIRVLVVAAEFAGHFMGYQIGLSLGSLIDPQTGVRNSTLALLYANVAVVVCLSTDAHHALLRALADSYAALPVGLGGAAGIDASLAGSVARLLGLVFVLGVRIAAPVVIVMLLVEVALALLARVAPSLNVMTAGAPVRIAVGLLVVAATVSVVPLIVTRSLPVVLDAAAAMAGAFR
jgi:flagellar biosynthetic protein FliR